MYAVHSVAKSHKKGRQLSALLNIESKHALYAFEHSCNTLA
ncbi:hypothetical protein GMES_1894 [Paraglaciecola mesophila KMM 241]|uniref:Uncharacterized protein n=1 Tax=Paraglaciecola mesophila KMM 241 TaxID=1128912 RepID=K6ZLE8_9ALTE|nr:hypothetical protein GMES_1894 [Paraglaciecola mesophila KMM 241]